MSAFKLAASLAATLCIAMTSTAVSAAPRAKPHPSPTPTPNPVYGRLSWREVGPAIAGGRVPAVAGSASDPFLYYLGAAGGGVWKSDDGGATWDPVFSKESVGAIGAVAIDPKDNKTVWVGTGEGNPRNDVSYGNGVYKTTDAGHTWRNVGVKGARYISRIAVNPRDTKVVVVGAFGDFFADNTNGGIWRTEDGGRSWSHTLYVGPQSGVSDLAMDLRNPSVIYAGVWQFRRVPWTFTSGGPQDGLYRSLDGGKTWSRLSGHGLPSGNMGRIGLAIAPSNSRRVYATIESRSGVLWRSDDGGDHWRLMSNDTLVNQRPFYFSHLAVDPSNANHVYGISEMLSESKDGGKKFKAIADSVHVDYHAMWIAPNNAKRMIVGEDGGYAITVNGGDSWSFSANLVIGQVYHTAFDDRNPYHICAPLQDNNAFCGPSNSLSGDGITNAMWKRVLGGDGMWAVPDPLDAHRIWADLQRGNIDIFDERTNTGQRIRPFHDPSIADFQLYAQPYRFNWDAPIAFAPWDGRIAWLGANVVFQTTDDGAHWQVISPDLTRNIKAHQQAAGGPIRLDVSGAEMSDNILDIEGSSLGTGEIWVGTDDGLIQVTKDGGQHWSNVTPHGAPTYARVETVAPSPLEAGTTFAIFDDHRLGNYKPYIYRTTDGGSSWQKIVTGLPDDQYVRTVRPDIHNADIIYAGTENGMWVSYDRGARWQSLKLNLPAVSVRDIRLQPTFNDIIIATHGRGLWILDDASALQGLSQARDSGLALFPIRIAYEYRRHSDILDTYNWYAAQDPPDGAIVTFYQRTPEKRAPSIEVYAADGRLIRAIRGTHEVKGKQQPLVSNDRGLNRITWDFHENGPVRWQGAAKDDYRGPKTGAMMPPGVYTVRLSIGGRSLSRNVEVKPDPRLSFTQADYEAKYTFEHEHYNEYSRVDIALNALDTLRKSLRTLIESAKHEGSRAAGALGSAQRVDRDREALFNTLTANFKNDEDGITRPGALREDLEDLLGVSTPPTTAELEYAKSVDARYRSAMYTYENLAHAVMSLNTELQAAGLRPIHTLPHITAS